MKKLFLIAGVIITGLVLSGCAKSNPAAAYHSYSYYTKHKKQAKAAYEACEKIPAFVNQNLKKFVLSKENENCFNAQNVFFHRRNDFNKRFFNITRKGDL
jgi:hypothetical protein